MLTAKNARLVNHKIKTAGELIDEAFKTGQFTGVFDTAHELVRDTLQTLKEDNYGRNP